MSSGALGDPVHFRAQRFQDWGRRDLAWRQLKSEAGTGELGDMLSHRLDYGHHPIGLFARISALMHRVYDSRIDAAGVSHPADVDDWVACIGTFSRAPPPASSTKVASGRARTAPPATTSAKSTAPAPAPAIASAIRTACRWAASGRFERIAVPESFLVEPASPRDPPWAGDPLQAFRYDQTQRFLQSILDGAPVGPSFRAGLEAQIVMAAIERSAASGETVSIEPS